MAKIKNFKKLLVLGLIAMAAIFFIYSMFFTTTIQDVSGGGELYHGVSSNVSFTIVNNMFVERHLSYKWEIDDNRAMSPISNNFTGSGNVTIPARSSLKITALVPPPEILGSEGTYAYIQVYDGNTCVVSARSN